MPTVDQDRPSDKQIPRNLLSDSSSTSVEIRPLRALIVGAAFAGLLGFWGPYNALVQLGPETTTDFTNAAAVFLLFFMAFFVNGLLRRFLPRQSFSTGELYIVYVMSAVSCSIATMGFTLYLVPMLPAISYFATPENGWAELVQPLVPHWLVPQGEQAIRGFYEGIARDEAIPWMAWVKPLLAWLPVLLGLYLVMIALPMIFRRQWIEHERLAYPLAQLPLLMGVQERDRGLNSFFRNPVMWIGFAIPFILGCTRALHAHYNFIPRVDLVHNLSIFGGTDTLNLQLTFPMMGFAFLVHQEVALSVWLFYVLGLVVKGYFNMIGVTRGVTVDLYGQADGGSIMSYVQFGALVALVANALWIGRGPLRELLRIARNPQSGTAGSDDLLTRSLLFQLLLGLLMMTGWFVAIGVPWWAAVAFVLTNLCLGWWDYRWQRRPVLAANPFVNGLLHRLLNRLRRVDPAAPGFEDEQAAVYQNLQIVLTRFVPRFIDPLLGPQSGHQVAHGRRRDGILSHFGNDGVLWLTASAQRHNKQAPGKSLHWLIPRKRQPG